MDSRGRCASGAALSPGSKRRLRLGSSASSLPAEVREAEVAASGPDPETRFALRSKLARFVAWHVFELLRHWRTRGRRVLLDPQRFLGPWLAAPRRNANPDPMTARMTGRMKLRRALKRAIVAAGSAGAIPRRVARGLLVLLGLVGT